MNGLGYDGGNRGRGSAFGLTGRHRLAPTAEPLALPSPTPAEPPSPMAAAAAAGWAFGSDAPPMPAGPAGGEPPASAGPAGSAGSAGAGGRGPDGTGGDGLGGSEGTYLGLPRRVRQANLAPELRGQPGTGPVAQQRSPEQASSRMAALQEGWLRGRLDSMGEWPGSAESNDREGGGS